MKTNKLYNNRYCTWRPIYCTITVLYMKPNVHFESYVAKLFLEWKMFRTKFVEKIKTHVLYSIRFFSEYCAVNEIMWENIVERCSPRKTIWPMLIACWVPKATNTHSQYVILFVLSLQVGCTKASQCYVMRNVSVFYMHSSYLRL